MGLCQTPAISSPPACGAVKEVKEGMVTDPIMITMAMLMDLSYCIGGQGVEVEVRRVGERIDPLCGQISLQWIRSVCSNPHQWEQELNKLAAAKKVMNFQRFFKEDSDNFPSKYLHWRLVLF